MIADRVVDGLGAGLGRNAGDLLRPLVEALTEPVAVTDVLVTPVAGGWANALDIDGSAPAWLAQLAGVRPDPTLTPAQQRDVIRSRATWATGTYRALVATIKSALVSEKRVTIDERDAGAWHATIHTYESDFAATTTQQTIRVLAERHRPAGVTFDFVFYPAFSYQEAELAADTYAIAEETAGTYADVEE